MFLFSLLAPTATSSPAHLRTRRPSPTTAEFTVTTRDPTLTARRRVLWLVAEWAVRAATVAWAVAVLDAKYGDSAEVFAGATSTSTSSSSSSSSSSSFPSTRQQEQGFVAALRAVFVSSSSSAALPLPPRLRLSAEAAHAWARRLVASTPPFVLLPLCALACYLSLLRVHRTEKLLVLRGLGIQTWSCCSRTILGRPSTRFIPTAKVRDVLVNEAFLGHEVRFYLAVVVEGEDDVVVVFRGVLPQRDAVLRVWNGVRGCLWEGGKPPRWAAGARS